MTQESIIKYISETFDKAQTVSADGNTFFFYGAERNFPFATLVTNDLYDSFSDLNRPSVFRLNIGVGKQTFSSLFGSDAAENNFDFTALNLIMPHPVYGKMHWVCVLNPDQETFQTVRQLLAEAYDKFVQKYSRVKTGRDKL